MNDWKTQIDKNRIPSHVAVIMDGNGRWAKAQGLPRINGHFQGVETVRRVTEACSEIGVKFLTLYAFSTENWNRPKDEVDALMSLMVSSLKAELPTFLANKIRLKAIGDLSSLPTECKQELDETIAATNHLDGLTLILALSYSSTWEIKNAIQQIATKVKIGALKVEDINDQVVDANLNTSEFPHPELMIRTSGELRISNFLLWQLAYAELYFTEIMWPDFSKENFYEAIVNYQNRERRFGKTSEQIVKP
jgi:undecaprenyl diphosphate synthase